MEKSNIYNLFIQYIFAKMLVISIVFIGTISIQIIPVSAQIAGISKGDRIRISSSLTGDNVLYGSVISFSSKSLQVLSKGNVNDIPYNSIRKLQVAKGRRSHALEGTALGITVGALIGGLIADGSYSSCVKTKNYGCIVNPLGRKQSTELGALVGGFLGGISGLIIGAATHSPRWKRVPVPVDVTIGIIPARFQKNGFRPMINVRFTLNRR